VKVRGVAERLETAGRIDRFEDRIRDGYLYGDFQFAIDARDDRFLRRGVFSCYQPVPADAPLTGNPKGFSAADWAMLTMLAHTDKARAFEMYASRYLETS